MKKVFISYRRDDNPAMAGRLYDSLRARFGDKNVFFDVDTIDGGANFKSEINNYISKSGVLLAVMSDRWYQLLSNRESTPQVPDYVKIELESAISHELQIIPILVGKHAKTEFERFCASNTALALAISVKQAVEVDEGKDYRVHADRLIHLVEQKLGFARARLLRAVGGLILVAFAGLIGYLFSELMFRVAYGKLPMQARSVGLTSIEDRSNLGQALPPQYVFVKPQSELCISGITCYRTFDQHMELVVRMVDSGKRLQVLIMDPESPEIAEMSLRLGKRLDHEIRTVIAIIKGNSALSSDKVQVRLMAKLPPFTAVLIDGDVGNQEVFGTKSKGVIRVQPVIAHNVQHAGVILEFEEGIVSSKKELNGYDFYADDLRAQWADAAGTEEKVKRIFQSVKN